MSNSIIGVLCGVSYYTVGPITRLPAVSRDGCTILLESTLLESTRNPGSDILLIEGIR